MRAGEWMDGVVDFEVYVVYMLPRREGGYMLRLFYKAHTRMEALNYGQYPGVNGGRVSAGWDEISYNFNQFNRLVDTNTYHIIYMPRHHVTFRHWISPMWVIQASSQRTTHHLVLSSCYRLHIRTLYVLTVHYPPTHFIKTIHPAIEA